MMLAAAGIEAAGRPPLPGVARPARSPARRGVAARRVPVERALRLSARHRTCARSGVAYLRALDAYRGEAQRRPSASSRSSTPCSSPLLARRAAGGSRLAASGFRKSQRSPLARRVTTAGTSTRRSTTGRTRARWAGATCRSGAPSRCRSAVRCSSSGAAPAASRFRWLAPACRLSASTAPSRCSRARAGARRARRLAARLPARPRRHPVPAVAGPAGRGRARHAVGTIRDGAGAVRDAAVAAARARPDGDADRGASRARAGRHARHRARRRSAVVGRVPKRVSLSGWRGRTGGAHVSLVESVRQDRARRLTIFDQEFTERRGRSTAVRTFSLAFRTLSVPQMVRRLEKAGFEISALLGDYKGRAVGSARRCVGDSREEAVGRGSLVVGRWSSKRPVSGPVARSPRARRSCGAVRT